MTFLATVPCDGCSTETPDPTGCEHDRELCPDCVAEGRCRPCSREGMELTWRLA